jgi:6-phosphogluconate dehydrogenase
MVHNGIEYGIMAAYAEGISVLRAANVGKQKHAVDAETTPLREPEHYQYDLKLPDIAEVWRRGSVIASWLLDLTAAALIVDPALSKFAGRVSDSGEGRWTIKAAIDEAVPVHVLTAALYERFSSRGEADEKLIAADRACRRPRSSKRRKAGIAASGSRPTPSSNSRRNRQQARSYVVARAVEALLLLGQVGGRRSYDDYLEPGWRGTEAVNHDILTPMKLTSQ